MDGAAARRASIGSYAVIGDGRSAALCAPDGSIDWWCVPRFDADPVFGRLVGGDAAGRFRMGPAYGGAPVTRHGYRPDSAVVETSWQTEGGELRLTQALVADVTGTLLPHALLVRRLSTHGGVARAQVLFDPRRGAARRPPRTERRNGAVVCSWRADALAVTSSEDWELRPGEPLTVAVRPGVPLTVAVSVASRGPLVLVPPERGWQELEATDAWWRDWAAGLGDGFGRWRGPVVRSLITLRMLTYAPSGAPVAAPTTSLPEVVGGERNWDYRYAWPRDASIGIAAFLAAGRPEEARAFLYWLLHATRLHRPRLPALLSLHGRRVPRQRDLPDWPGYADSRPVRFGNDARDQHQLDGYGWVLDAGWLLVATGHRLFAETWRALSGFADQVARRWREPDSGIWEVPGPPRHYVHSKLMGWLALDRALRIAASHRTSPRRRARWERERNALAADIRAHGVDAARGCLVRSYGSTELDAALLILPVLEFAAPDDPLVANTVAAVRNDLRAGADDLVYRYPLTSDGLPGREAAFLPCSFWLVQALARSGRVQEASTLFDRLVARGQPLGLYAEEVDPDSGAQIGNYPQAFTHATLVQAALALRDATQPVSSAPSSAP